MTLLFLLIVMRITGAVVFNPMLGRIQMPKSVKAAFVFVLSTVVFLTTSQPYPAPDISFPAFLLMLLRELFPGLILGFGVALIVFIIQYASALIDYMMGLNMAQIYDPQSNSQVTLSSGIYNACLMLLVFTTDTHLKFLSLILQSGDYMPYGQVAFGGEIPLFMLEVFKRCIVLGVQFAFPIMAVELLGEVVVGILMRVVPQINVFVVNFQIKILLGLFMMLFLQESMGAFIKRLLSLLIENTEKILVLFSGI